MLNLKSLVSPSLARQLPEGSPERALASMSLRLMWHQVFDPCPKLLALAPPDGKSLLEPFLDHLLSTRRSGDWRLHLELYQWMSQNPDFAPALTPETVRELMAAAAARWATSDLSSAPGIALLENRNSRSVIVGVKSRGPQERRTVVELRTRNEMASLEALDGVRCRGPFTAFLSSSQIPFPLTDLKWSLALQG